MPTGQQKIRIYDLAKELKLDNKKVMEDARREGIDVSVPSNTVPHEVAERIRLKYFPKKVAPHVGPRLSLRAYRLRSGLLLRYACCGPDRARLRRRFRREEQEVLERATLRDPASAQQALREG